MARPARNIPEHGGDLDAAHRAGGDGLGPDDVPVGRAVAVAPGPLGLPFVFSEAGRRRRRWSKSRRSTRFRPLGRRASPPWSSGSAGNPARRTARRCPRASRSLHAVNCTCPPGETVPSLSSSPANSARRWRSDHAEVARRDVLLVKDAELPQAAREAGTAPARAAPAAVLDRARSPVRSPSSFESNWGPRRPPVPWPRTGAASRKRRCS